MTTDIWHIWTDGPDEFDYLHGSAEVLGRHTDAIHAMSMDLFETAWDAFTTFTRSDHASDPELYGDIDPDSLPSDKVLFEPQQGLERFAALRRAIAALDPDDSEDLFLGDREQVLEEIDGLLQILARTRAEGRRWYLEIEVDY